MEHDTITFREAGNDFCHSIVAMADLDSGRMSPPALDGEDCPVLTLPK